MFIILNGHNFLFNTKSFYEKNGNKLKNIIFEKSPIFPNTVKKFPYINNFFKQDAHTFSSIRIYI